MKISRQAYADMFGPTVGDRVRWPTPSCRRGREGLHRLRRRSEIRRRQSHSRRHGPEPTTPPRSATPLITNALIIDHWGIVKADVGLKDGRIAASARPATRTSAQREHRDRRRTEVIAGEGMILTAGGIDTHIHFICPQQIEEALMSGVTTMIGGGTGPATGTNATTCTPGAWNLRACFRPPKPSR